MDRFEDFSSMSAEERQEWTAQAAGLSPEQRELLRQGGGLPLEVADSMIDNVIGTYALPIGVVRGMVVNAGRPVRWVPCHLYRLHHDLPDTDYPGHQPTCCLP